MVLYPNKLPESERVCSGICINWKFANFLSPYCFSIYLVHTIFTNFLYKGLKIEITDYFPVSYGQPIFFTGIIISSFILSYFMYKIPDSIGETVPS